MICFCGVLFEWIFCSYFSDFEVYRNWFVIINSLFLLRWYYEVWYVYVIFVSYINIVVIVEIKIIVRIIKIIMILVIMLMMMFYKNIYFW